MRIEARNLIKVYGDRSVVNDVTFDINKGEVVCLLGPNGAGKTTTFYMVVGLVKPYKGHIFLDDEDISNWPMNLRAKAGIGYLPQETSIFRKLNVEDNYLIPIIENGIVVFIGNKDNYGKTVIIEQVDGIDVWYSNIKANNIKMYDYIEKGSLIGEVKGKKLYMVFQKDGAFLDYKKYI